jgi:hypothetical protein
MISALKIIYSAVPAWALWAALAALGALNAWNWTSLQAQRVQTSSAKEDLAKLKGENARDAEIRAKAVAEAYASYRNTERREAARIMEIEANARTAQVAAKRALDDADRKLASLLDLIRRLTAPAPAGDPVGGGPPGGGADPQGPGGPIAALGDGYGACLKEYRAMGERSEERRIKLKAALEWIDLVRERAAAGRLVLPPRPAGPGPKTERGGTQAGAPG